MRQLSALFIWCVRLCVGGRTITFLNHWYFNDEHWTLHTWGVNCCWEACQSLLLASNRGQRRFLGPFFFPLPLLHVKKHFFVASQLCLIYGGPIQKVWDTSGAFKLYGECLLLCLVYIPQSMWVALLVPRRKIPKVVKMCLVVFHLSMPCNSAVYRPEVSWNRWRDGWRRETLFSARTCFARPSSRHMRKNGRDARKRLMWIFYKQEVSL